MTIPTKTPRKFDTLEQEAYLNLWRTYDRLRAIEDNLFEQHELSAQQYNALRILRGEHPKPIPTLLLARRLVSHAPDITRLLDKLEGRKLIVRERPEHNRRMVLVGLTKEGLALLSALDQPVRKCSVEQFGHMTSEQLKSLVQLLKAARRPHESSDTDWL